VSVKLLKSLEKAFIVKTCGFFLNMSISRLDDGSFISQKVYAESILQKFNIEDSNSVSIPIEKSNR